MKPHDPPKCSDHRRVWFHKLMLELRKCLPIISWLPSYRRAFLVPDTVAGITVGLTAVPQAIAYAAVAGLEPQFGLNSAFMGCFVYIVFGSCKDITIGPTAIMSLLVQSHALKSPDYAVLSCFLTGLLILLLALLNLGTLVKFISVPVTIGFTMAAASTIASGQISNLFGIPNHSSGAFISSWRNVLLHFQEARLNDSILGLTSLIFLLFLKRLGRINFPCKVLKYISLSRNALAVIIGIALCYNLRLSSDENELAFQVGRKIVAGLPAFQLPPFETTIVPSPNTYNETLSAHHSNVTIVYFDHMVRDLGASLITIPFICILESVTIAKSFSKGSVVNANQEMVALGFSNLMGGFVSSMPVTGSFTRSAINNASGVRTPLGGILTGSLVLLALLFLTQTFYYLPKTTLSAIIISAMLNMLNEYQHVYKIWKSKKSDLLPFMVTVCLSLFWSLEYGIVGGILVNLLQIVRRGTRLTIEINEKHHSNIMESGSSYAAPSLWVVETSGNLCYATAEHFRATIVKYVTEKTRQRIGEVLTADHGDNCDDNQPIIAIKGHNIREIDATVAQNIFALEEDLAVLDCQLICWDWNRSCRNVLGGMNALKSKLILRDRESLAANASSAAALEPLLLNMSIRVKNNV